MLLTIGIVLMIAWLLGFTVFHVSAVAIHLLVVLAVIAVVVHIARGRRAT
jgi:hypothetical protein